MPDLAVLYEHPRWFEPLFAALARRGVDVVALRPGVFDPMGDPPARVVLNRVAMSAASREAEHPIFWARSALAHWERRGARVLNGAAALAFDTSKAEQLSLIASLGLGTPRTRAVHRAADVAAAADAVGYPLLVKANIGGAGANIARYDDARALAAAIADGALPTGIDGVRLVQELVPARGGVLRLETLDRAFLYAIEVTGAAGFDLCPADACAAGTGIRMAHVEPAPALRAAAEAIARAAHLDLGGVELLIDDRDGAPKFFDVNALSNFVANPLGVLGFDPHEALVDRLVAWIGEAR